MKLCINCIYCKKVSTSSVFPDYEYYCYRMVKQTTSPVDGMTIYVGPYARCDMERTAQGSCGPEGKYHAV